MSESGHELQRWRPSLTNEAVAAILDEIAELLENQAANPFRVRAYRLAAETLRSEPVAVSEIYHRSGTDGLTRLPTIGQSLAHSIEQLLLTGSLPLLQRLRGDHAPHHAFTSVADVGEKLAERIHETLGIETLAELEVAAWDGRLEQIPGMGRKRIQAIRDSLAGRFRREARARRQARDAVARKDSTAVDQPPVSELLDVDLRYRRLAQQDRLPRIAPRRFNPHGEAWLPIFHTHCGDRHYTALYSNTARAHELGTTRDWVIIYRDDHQDHGQWTVITAGLGPLRGRRIVRGREAECRAWYKSQGDDVR